MSVAYASCIWKMILKVIHCKDIQDMGTNTVRAYIYIHTYVYMYTCTLYAYKSVSYM